MNYHIRQILIPLMILLIAALGCGLFSAKNSTAEEVFPATDIGMPQGEKATKDIGTAGGSMTSPDGRLTLTVPVNALTETVSFSIQPIVNKADGGLGLAYRLEPNGKTFDTPLEISLRYDDHDLEGTVPEALSLAYQDPQGSWNSIAKVVLDQHAKTVTVPVTHFTDWSFLSRLRISPESATVHVGEKLNMQITPCHFQNNLSNRIKRWLGGVAVCELTNGKYYFDLQPNWFADIGTIDTPKEIHAVYTAPAKKPSPNIATVSIPYEFDSRGETYEPPKRGMLVAHITIIDRGYKAGGHDGPTTYSGTICDLSKPFTITGNNTLVPYPLQFVPSTATAGTLSYTATYKMLTMTGSGTYTIEGADTDTPKIVAQTKSTLSAMGRSSSGSGPAHIDLTPLDGNECSGDTTNPPVGVSTGVKKTLAPQ